MTPLLIFGTLVMKMGVPIMVAGCGTGVALREAGTADAQRCYVVKA